MNTLMAVKAKKRAPLVKKTKKGNRISKFNGDPVVTPIIPEFGYPQYNILPESFMKKLHPFLRMAVSNLPYKKDSRAAYIASYRNFPNPHKMFPENHHKNISNIAALITGMRRKMTKLARLYRFSKLSSSNTEDIVTMEVPKYPVWIVDWENNTKYVFEAHTLIKDITTRLLHHDGIFAEPQFPRNPLTNLNLTTAQLVCVWRQIFSMPLKVSFAITAFKLAGFSIDRFELINDVYLQINALKDTMNLGKCFDYREKMEDFMFDIHTQRDVDPCKLVIGNAVRQHSEHRLIKAWAKNCYKFYEAEILYRNNPGVLLKEKEKITQASYGLVRSYRQMVVMYDKDFPPQPVVLIDDYSFGNLDDATLLLMMANFN